MLNFVPKGCDYYSSRRVGDGISNHKKKKYNYEHSEPYSLVMFNRDGMRHKSQKKGKQASSRKFRRKANVLLHQGKEHLLPLKSFEVMSPWDLGGDGKAFFGFHPEEEWFVKLMRK